MKPFLYAAAFAAGAAILPAVAGACPDPSLAPYFGTIELSPGFMPDPLSFRVSAGGTENLESCPLRLPGYVFQRPDLSFEWRGNTQYLTMLVQSQFADAVLVVRGPWGHWWYFDDFRGTDPVVRLENPAEGSYHVWVGSHDQSGSRDAAQLIFTEGDP